ncbi:MAG: hypothetical protein IJI50_07100 [Ruminococcus sp.]|nr:hypothetical protein [Ruminococcus sp.]
MISLLEVFEYCAGSAMLVLMLMALAYSIVMPSPDRWSRNYFITFFSLLTLSVCSCIFAAIFYGKTDYAHAEKTHVLFRIYPSIGPDAYADAPPVTLLR